MKSEKVGNGKMEGTQHTPGVVRTSPYFSGWLMHREAVDRTLMTAVNSPAKREGRPMLEIITNVLALVLLLFQPFGSCANTAYADDPMNKPLDSLRVFDYDRSLCNDKWNTCGDYERTSFGFQYPGRSISELGLYPEAEERQVTPIKDRLTGSSIDTEGARWLFENADWTPEEYAQRFPANK
jgi:hypothetical protein